MPVRVSETMVLDSATACCVCLDMVRMNLPKNMAARMATGKEPSIHKVSCQLKVIRASRPPPMMMVWRTSSAKTVVKVSRMASMSAAMRLPRSPTLRVSKKAIGWVIMPAKASSRSAFSMRVVISPKSQIRMKLSADCRMSTAKMAVPMLLRSPASMGKGNSNPVPPAWASTPTPPSCPHSLVTTSVSTPDSVMSAMPKANLMRWGRR